MRISKRLDNLMSMMQFPYVTALSALILMLKGLEAEPVMWISLAIAIGTILLVIFYREL